MIRRSNCMFVLGCLTLFLCTIPVTNGFSGILPFRSSVSSITSSSESSSSSALFMGKTRKAKKVQEIEKQSRSRPQQFYDAIEEAGGKKPKLPDDDKKGKEKEEVDSKKDRLIQEASEAANTDEAKAEREARAVEIQKRMEARPEVSTMIVDEETGIEVIAQGKAVMDVVTRKAVRLSSSGPEYRLAQMFPGVPPEVRTKHRIHWKTATVPDMVERLRKACEVKLEDGTRGIPPHPSLSYKAIDFVLANRDLLGARMKRTLGRLSMRSMWLGNKDEARENNKLWKNFLTLENYISAPFRQIIMDAEGRVGPNFGNLDVKSFADGELYERAANYLVLKGMVATWEKKVRDAEYIESTPQGKENFLSLLSVGDPKRFLPDPPILFTVRECTQVCLMSQQMCKAFVETPELFNDLPPELRFIERALSIKGGTLLRKFMLDEFCPAEEITAEALREGMRRLYQQMENMQIDPYGDLTNIIDRLIQAMSVGTDDAQDPYADYLYNLDPKGPGYFQSYTFDHEKLSLVRFLDGQYPSAGEAEMPQLAVPDLFGKDFFGGADFFGGNDFFGGINKKDAAVPPPTPPTERYRVPEERAAGRPHELGWLDLLKDEKTDRVVLGKVPAGRIIPDDDDE